MEIKTLDKRKKPSTNHPKKFFKIHKKIPATKEPFFGKVAVLETQNFQKELDSSQIPVNFAKFSPTTFLRYTSKRLLLVV